MPGTETSIDLEDRRDFTEVDEDGLRWDTYDRTRGAPSSTPTAIARNIHPRLRAIVKQVQRALGFQVTLTSGRRPISVNEAVGSGNPAHLRGLAVDIWVPAYRDQDVINALKLFSGELEEIILERSPRHIHVALKGSSGGDSGNTVIIEANTKFEPLPAHEVFGDAPIGAVYYTPKTRGRSPTEYSIVGSDTPNQAEDITLEGPEANKPGAFRVGAVWLDVPPTRIEVSETNNIYEIPTIRTPGSPYTRDGRSNIVVDFDVIFPNADSINNKLRHVLAQIRRSPFLPVENYFLQSILYPEIKPAEPPPPVEFEPLVDVTKTTTGDIEKTSMEDQQRWFNRQQRLDDSIAAKEPGDVESIIADIEVAGKSALESEDDFQRRIRNLRRIPDYLRRYRRITANTAGISTRDQVVVLCMREISVSSIPGSPEALQMHITAELFNYLPYTNLYAFVKDVGGQEPTFNITSSQAFLNYYRGLLYKEGKPEFPASMPSVSTRLEALTGHLSAPIILKYVYSAAERTRTLDALNAMRKHVQLWRLLQSTGDMEMRSPRDTEMIASELFENIQTFLTSPLTTGWIKITSELSQGIPEYVRSYFSSLGDMHQTFQYVRKIASQTIGKDRYLFLDNSRAIYVLTLKNEIPVLVPLTEFKSQFGLHLEELEDLARSLVDFEFNQTILDNVFETLTLGDQDSEITGINCQYAPKLVPIPIISYVSPTYQYMGASNWIITLNIRTSSPSVLQNLRIMNERMNRLALRFNPTGDINNISYLDNTARILEGTIFKFLGINHILPGNFRFSTIPGIPGAYNITIDMVQVDLSVRRYERLTSQASFSGKLMEDILDNIELNPTLKALRHELYDEILTDFDGRDFKAIQQWRSGTHPKFPFPEESRRWNKVFFNLSKPVPAMVLDRRPTPGVLEFLREFSPNLTLDGIDHTFVEGRRPTVPTGVGADPIQDFQENQRPEAGVIQEGIKAVYKTAAILLIRDQLEDALAYDILPEMIRSNFTKELLDRMDIERKVFSDPLGTYPDLDLPRKGLGPDFFYYKPSFFDVDSVESQAITFSNLTKGLSLDIAQLNNVNRFGDTERPLMELSRTAREATLLTDIERWQRITRASEKAVDLKKQLSTDLVARAEAMLSDIDLPSGYSNREMNPAYWEKVKRFHSSRIEELDVASRIFDLVSQSDNPERIKLRNLVESWGIITTEERDLNRTILLDSLKYRDDKTLSLGRAYPTFKLYFIEKDKNEWLLFDDFYGFSAVKSIRINSHRERATSSAVLELSNISNVLNDYSTINMEDPLQGGTSEEQNIDSFLLRVGAEIMIRMGYSNDPTELDIVFQGSVTAIQPGETMVLSAQSWGAELLYPIGTGPDFSVGRISTVREFGDLATAIINEVPGMQHFGTTYNLAEILDIISDPLVDRAFTAGFWSKIKNSAILLHELGPSMDHRMDNIWLPYNSAPWNGSLSIWKLLHRSIRDILGGKGPAFDWIISNKTAWESLEEILHYFPGYIIKTLPYNAKDIRKARQTLYIGPAIGYYRAEDDAEYIGDLYKSNLDRYIERKKLWFSALSSREFDTEEELKTYLGENGWDFSKEVFQDAYKSLVRQSSILFLPGRQYSVNLNFETTPLYTQFDTSFLAFLQSTFSLSTGGLDFLGPFQPGIVDPITRKLGLGALEMIRSHFNDLWLRSGREPFIFDGLWATTGKIERIADRVLRKWKDVNRRGLSNSDTDLAFNVFDIYDVIHSKEYLDLVDDSGITGKVKSQTNTTWVENPRELMKGGTMPRGFEKVCRTHFADSYHHIISNDIQASAEGFANKIILTFPKGEPSSESARGASFTPSDGVSSVEVVVDDNIRADLIRAKGIFESNIDIDRVKKYYNYTNQIGGILSNVFQGTPLVNARVPEIPVEYIVANVHLNEELKKMYGGSLTLLLNPAITPHDTVYVHDDINEMYGPILVREVTHVFDSKQGAYTVVVPDLHSYVGDMRSTINGIYSAKLVNAAVKLSLIPMGLGLGLGVAAGARGFLAHPYVALALGAGILGGGLYGAYKISSTILLGGYGDLLGRQMGQFIPLWYKGQPYVAGVEGMRKDDFLVHIVDTVHRFTDIKSALGMYVNTRLLY